MNATQREIAAGRWAATPPGGWRFPNDRFFVFPWGDSP